MCAAAKVKRGVQGAQEALAAILRAQRDKYPCRELQPPKYLEDPPQKGLEVPPCPTRSAVVAARCFSVRPLLTCRVLCMAQLGILIIFQRSFRCSGAGMAPHTLVALAAHAPRVGVHQIRSNHASKASCPDRAYELSPASSWMFRLGHVGYVWIMLVEKASQVLLDLDSKTIHEESEASLRLEGFWSAVFNRAVSRVAGL